jgi:hypothetical protein
MREFNLGFANRAKASTASSEILHIANPTSAHWHPRDSAACVRRNLQPFCARQRCAGTLERTVGQPRALERYGLMAAAFAGPCLQCVLHL